MAGTHRCTAAYGLSALICAQQTHYLLDLVCAAFLGLLAPPLVSSQLLSGPSEGPGAVHACLPKPACMQCTQGCLQLYLTEGTDLLHVHKQMLIPYDPKQPVLQAMIALARPCKRTIAGPRHLQRFASLASSRLGNVESQFLALTLPKPLRLSIQRVCSLQAPSYPVGSFCQCQTTRLSSASSSIHRYYFLLGIDIINQCVKKCGVFQM